MYKFFESITKEERRRIQRDGARKRYHRDASRRKICLLRLMHAAIMKKVLRGGPAETKRQFGLIGCSIETYRKHLEDSFSNGMCWENYGRGGWVVDHIIPIYEFVINNQSIDSAFNYRNTTARWWSDNARRTCKIFRSVVK